MIRRLKGIKRFRSPGRMTAVFLALTLSLFSIQGGIAIGETGKNAAAIKFKDVTASHWAYADIDSMVTKGIITGYNVKNDTFFRPDANVTRAEFAKMISLGAKLDMSKVDSNHFLDVQDTHWAFKFVEAAYLGGVIGGYGDYTFRPVERITRAEMATMIIKAGNYKLNTNTNVPSDLTSSHWAYDYVMTAKKIGVMNGYGNGTFAPNGYATRAEACKMILRSLYDVLGEKITNAGSPTIIISSPTTSTDHTTTSNKISLSGTASDNESVSKVTWSNSTGGSGTATGTNRWSIADITLTEGLNTITVTVTDNRNNTNTDTIKVTRQIPATTGTLSGTIDETPTGSHLSGANVSVYLNGVLKGSVNTGSAGTYSLSLSPASGYNIVVSKAGYSNYAQSGITITASIKTTVNVKLAPSTTGTMNGVVDDSSTGFDLVDVWVKVYSSASPSIPSWETTTTATGSYSLTLPVGSNYRAEFGKTGYKTYTIDSIAITGGLTVTYNVRLETDTP
ncbi:MAG: S-layer homology domain-containing protein [Rubrobacteridae bacterium]|nr:S-layer homology domain-containing protein [Rubrobacteridae bacterium]